MVDTVSSADSLSDAEMPAMDVQCVKEHKCQLATTSIAQASLTTLAPSKSPLVATPRIEKTANQRSGRSSQRQSLRLRG